jgi:DNA repair protein RecO (recombination protein O)
MEWTDEGIVLSVQPHGETSALISLLTAEHGRHKGLVRGGAGKSGRGVLQPGNRVRVVWKARLSEHLGHFVCEMTSATASQWLHDPLRLAGVSAACAVADATLPERQPHPAVHLGLAALLAGLEHDGWPSLYVRWELGLLGELGFSLDLSSCAAIGSREDLAYVSPKSGRAVSRSAGEPYRDRLLTLPRFLNEGGEGTPDDVLAGLTLTGYFLERHALSPHGKALPPARWRLVGRLSEGRK